MEPCFNPSLCGDTERTLKGLQYPPSSYKNKKQRALQPRLLSRAARQCCDAAEMGGQLCGPSAGRSIWHKGACPFFPAFHPCIRARRRGHGQTEVSIPPQGPLPVCLFQPFPLRDDQEGGGGGEGSRFPHQCFPFTGRRLLTRAKRTPMGGLPGPSRMGAWSQILLPS